MMNKSIYKHLRQCGSTTTIEIHLYIEGRRPNYTLVNEICEKKNHTGFDFFLNQIKEKKMNKTRNPINICTHT